jgi:hypothetical protein
MCRLKMLLVAVDRRALQLVRHVAIHSFPTSATVTLLLEGCWTIRASSMKTTTPAAKKTVLFSLGEVQSFKRLQISQQITNLVRTQLKGWHPRMAGRDTFGQRLGQSLDWVACMQRTEWRRGFERALRKFVDRMTFCAVVPGVFRAARGTRQLPLE